MNYKHSLKQAGKKAAYALAIALPLSTSAYAAFECPTQPLEAARASAIAAVLPTGDAFDDRVALASAVTTLKAEGASLPMVVDNLISAYCPTVADVTGLTDAEKTAKVNQFASRITRTVYNLESADGIILDINFPTLMMDAIEAAAKASNVSANDWVKGVVAEALK